MYLLKTMNYHFIKKPLEIPYNFDVSLINFLKYSKYAINIHSIYCCPFFQDYLAAKHYFILQHSSKFIKNKFTIDRNEYERQMQYINQNFPNTLMLLLQNPNQILNKNLINYYIALGFTKFCVASIEQAKIIKQIDPNLEITGSIIMQISIEKIEANFNMYLQYFDNFVLFFPFNRNLNLIQKLPSDFKYVLLINSGCLVNCDGVSHWLADESTEKNFICLKDQQSYTFKDTIQIRPNDLFLFDKYISYFKLLGREKDTYGIITDIIMYNTNFDMYHIFDDINVEELYQIKKEEDLIKN